ncbi:HEPN domain-containing protein [Olivibacter jilunii]|uniref:HEPN domain-containing protein n=1 Tax=Olivibacter jilunii TaxID=985016 RepID=UPI001031F220|nr:HEPN domain-containing protein [Olivibacter jilunii]
MYIAIVAPNRYLQILEDEKTFSFENILITNEHKYLDEWFERETLRKEAGEYLKRQLYNGAYAFTVLRLSEIRSYEDIPQLVFDFQVRLNSFFNFLWFLEDSNIFFPETFFIKIDEGKVIRNYNTFSPKRADFTQKVTLLNEKKFNDLLTFYKTSNNLLLPNLDIIPKEKRKHLQGYNLNDISLNKLSRIHKAKLFLDKIREEIYVILRIALCISLLENLFNGGGEKISKMVCQRAACYIGAETIGKIKENERLINKAYDIRSKYFHGQSLKSAKEFKQQQEILIKLENIIRTIFNKLIGEKGGLFLETDKIVFNFTFNEMTQKIFPVQQDLA